MAEYAFDCLDHSNFVLLVFAVHSAVRPYENVDLTMASDPYIQ